MVNPTGYTALDLVGFTDKGPYDPNVNYVRNDLSHDSGNIWRCLIDDTIGIRPTEGANWTIFISEPSNMVETSIAPIEISPATAAHTVGTQLYYNDTLYKVKAAIAVGDSLVVDTNIELADNITTQLAAKANTSDLGTAAAKDSTSAIAQGSTDLIESGAVYSALGDKANTADLGTAAAKDSTNAVTQSSTDLVESGAVYSELSSVKQALTDKAEITSKASAAVVNITDAMGVNAKHVVAKITPAQAGTGTPSPSNVRAISGYTNVKVTSAAKNLFDPSVYSAYKQADGTYRATASTIHNIHVPIPKEFIGKTLTFSVYIDLSKETYPNRVCVSANVNDSFTTGDKYNDGNKGYSTVTFTPQTVNDYIFITYGTNGSNYYTFSNIQLEENSSRTTYESYKGHEVTFSLGDTIYGGELDVETGVLTVDSAITDENANWSYVATASAGGLKYVQRSDATIKTNGVGITNMLLVDNDNAWSSTTPVAQIYRGSGEHGMRVYGNFTSLDEFRTSFSGLQFLYELTTPITIQLTPQDIQLLEGLNNIYANSGNVAVDYYKQTVGNLAASVSDTQEKVNELRVFNEIFGTVENGDTASKAYSQGDYFVRGNQMAKAKTSIAKGATFTLNTNYEVKSLAEILKTIETT